MFVLQLAVLLLSCVPGRALPRLALPCLEAKGTCIWPGLRRFVMGREGDIWEADRQVRGGDGDGYGYRGLKGG